MKVAIDSRSYAQSGIGAYTRILLEQLPLLSEKSGAADEFLPVSDGLSDHASEKRLPGWRQYFAGMRRLYWENIQLPKQLRLEQFDLLHNPRNAGVPYRPQCPVVVTVHDLIPLIWPQEYLPSRVHRLLYQARVQRSIGNSDFILTDSNFSATEICRFFPQARQKIAVVPLASAPQFCVQKQEAERGIIWDDRLAGQPFILALGGSEARKNNRCLIRAFRSLTETQRRRHKLVIVGGAWRGIDLKTESQADALGDVIFISTVTSQQLVQLYNQATAFVFPSLYEGFGLPVLEAMACGTPVICSSAGSMPEVAGTAAIMIDPVDESAMAESIGQVLASPALQAELAEQGLLQCQKFSWDNTLVQTYEIYQQVAR